MPASAVSLAQLLLRILQQELARSEQQPDPTVTYIFLREVQQASAPGTPDPARAPPAPTRTDDCLRP